MIDLRNYADLIRQLVKKEDEKDPNWKWSVKSIGKNKVRIRWGYLDFLGEKENCFIIEMQEEVRDHAVRELGALANTAARERLERQAQAAAYEALGAWEYLGEFAVTAYCPCEECCGRWAEGVTATGLPAAPGVVAVDLEVIPLGSTVIIDGQAYLAADTGVTGNRVDICVTDHRAAEAFGARSEEVWVTNGR